MLMIFTQLSIYTHLQAHTHTHTSDGVWHTSMYADPRTNVERTALLLLYVSYVLYECIVSLIRPTNKN